MRQLLSLLAALVLLSSLSAQVPAYVPTDGLVGWWPFNGNANDESGNGNNGTVNGATLTNDRMGVSNGAYSFNGINNYVQLGPDPFIAIDQLDGSDYTISLWFNNYANAGGSLFMNFGWGARIYTDSTFATFGHVGIWPDNQWYYVAAGGEPTINSNWYNVVAVKNGASQSIYANGVLMGTAVSNPCQLGAKVYVGGDPVDNNGWLNGAIDDVGFWNRALTQQEITALFNTQVGSPCVSSAPVSFSGLSSSYVPSDPVVTLVGTPDNGVFTGPGISGNTFDPAVAGEGTHGISYTYLDSNNCVNTYSLCTSVDLGSGVVGDERTASGVHVYPNPNRGQFTVEMELQGLVSMQVFDVRGRQVHNEVFRANGAKTMRTLDLSGLAQGTYSLVLENEGRRVGQQVILN